MSYQVCGNPMLCSINVANIRPPWWWMLHTCADPWRQQLRRAEVNPPTESWHIICRRLRLTHILESIHNQAGSIFWTNYVFVSVFVVALVNIHLYVKYPSTFDDDSSSCLKMNLNLKLFLSCWQDDVGLLYRLKEHLGESLCWSCLAFLGFGNWIWQTAAKSSHQLLWKL